MTGILGRVVGRLLEAPATVGELMAAAGPGRERDVEDLVRTLVGKGFLANETTDALAQYLGYVAGRTSELEQRTVAVVGCGPLGARVAAGLAQHGIRSLRLGDDRPVDDDWQRFAPSGLTRVGDESVLAGAAVATWLLGEGHGAQWARQPLEGEGLAEVVAGVDLAVLAFEQVDLRLAHLLNRHAVTRGFPWLHTVIDGNTGVVGPLFKVPETACYNEFQTLRTAATPSAAMMKRYQAHVLARGRGSFFPGLPSHADLVAAYTVLAAVHYLLTGTCFAFGRAMFVDLERMVIDTDEVLRLPRCPVCGVRRRPARPLFEPAAAEDPSDNPASARPGA